jgi:molybdopterin synthase catalytic subunit
MGESKMFDVARPDATFARLTAQVTNDVIFVGDVLDSVRSTACGGIGLFVGTVRVTSSSPEIARSPVVSGISPSDVVGLRYDAYEDGALAEFERIMGVVVRRFPSVQAVGISHRYGYIPLGQDSVVVAASAPHRHEALEATTFVIDAVKFRAPIWKQEVFRDGRQAAWIGCEHVHVVAS